MQYRVVETLQFRRLWQSAVNAGIIDSVAASLLQGLSRLLASDPYYFPPFETGGEPIGLRWINFIGGSSVRVEIWYSVVEDDRCVYLESVEIIYRS